MIPGSTSPGVDAALDATAPSGLLIPPSSGLRSAAAALLEGRTDRAERTLRLLAADPTVDAAWRNIVEGRLLLTRGQTTDAGFRFSHAAALAFSDAHGLPTVSGASPANVDVRRTDADGPPDTRTSQRHLRVAGYALNFLGDACRRGDRPDEAVRHHLRAYALWSSVGSRVERALAASNVGLDHDILDDPDAAMAWHDAAARLVRASADVGWDATPLGWAAPPSGAASAAPPTVSVLLLARQRDTLARFARFDEALAVGQVLIDHLTSLRPGGVEVLRCRLRRCDVLRRKAEQTQRDDPGSGRDSGTAPAALVLERCRAELLHLVEEFSAFGASAQRERIEADEQLDFVERLLGVAELDDVPPSPLSREAARGRSRE